MNIGQAELPLFEVENSSLITPPLLRSEQTVVTEEKFIAPLVEVLDVVSTAIPKPDPKVIPKSLRESLDELFPEQQYDEKSIQKAKELLGPIAKESTAEQLKDAVIEIQYLCESWLDDFERTIFKGETLTELLHEKGGR